MAKGMVNPDDGKPRCQWAATDALLATYHDRQWGKAIRTDAGHLERLTQEVFQCGLSWKIVLVKSPALHEAFAGFEPERVARFGKRELNRLVNDARIIRNRRKIEATIHNAAVMVALANEHGSYRKWLNKQPAKSEAEIAALYPLFKKTFKFMGPETTKCYLMGCGKIPPFHEPHCYMATE